jgi:general secretion pathway protein N
MNAEAQRRLTPVLGGLAAVFGLLLLLLVAGIGRAVRWEAPRPVSPLPEAHDKRLPPPVPLDQFAAVWTQPLFNADRKPGMRAASGSASLGDMQLTGIILTPSLHMALLRDKSGEHEVRVREGDSLPDGSWRLAELKPRAAIFESASGRTELGLPAGAPIDMPKNAATANGMAPPPAPPPAPMPPGAVRMVTGPVLPASSASMPNANAPGATQINADSQSDRIRQLKEAIQKRRAEQSAAPPEGAH